MKNPETYSHPLGLPRKWRIAPELLEPAKRCADAMNAASEATGFWERPGWVAISLQFGSSDGRIYESWDDAKRFQLHEDQCMYLQVQRLPMPLADAAHLIALHREMYRTGFRPVNPEYLKGLKRG